MSYQHRKKKLGNLLLIAFITVVALLLLSMQKGDSVVTLRQVDMPEYNYSVLQLYIPFGAGNDEEVQEVIDFLKKRWLELNPTMVIDQRLTRHDFLSYQGNATQYYLTKPR